MTPYQYLCARGKKNNESGHMLFSCPADGTGNDITYEKEFTECPEVKPYLTEDIDDEWRELNGTFVSTVGNNEFVIETYDGNDTFDETGNKYFILYDIATNSAKRFERGSLEYCLITAKGYTEYEELDGRHF